MPRLLGLKLVGALLQKTMWSLLSCWPWLFTFCSIYCTLLNVLQECKDLKVVLRNVFCLRRFNSTNYEFNLLSNWTLENNGELEANCYLFTLLTRQFCYWAWSNINTINIVFNTGAPQSYVLNPYFTPCTIMTVQPNYTGTLYTSMQMPPLSWVRYQTMMRRRRGRR